MPTKKVEKTIDLPDGEYAGKIVENKVEAKGEAGYEYHETFIEVETEGNPQIKIGCPFSITDKTILGQILQRFGAELKEGEDLDTDNFLKKDTKVKFTVTHKKGKLGMSFMTISTDTFRPAE